MAKHFCKYLHTSLDVNPFHDWNIQFLISSIHVDGKGMKAASCRYCISSIRDDIRCKLLLFYIFGFVGDALSCAVIGVSHNPFILSLATWMIILPLHLIVTSRALNTAVYPVSHIFSIEKS